MAGYHTATVDGLGTAAAPVLGLQADGYSVMINIDVHDCSSVHCSALIMKAARPGSLHLCTATGGYGGDKWYCAMAAWVLVAGPMHGAWSRRRVMLIDCGQWLMSTTANHCVNECVRAEWNK